MKVALAKGTAFYQYCYAMIMLDWPSAKISYYEDRDGGRLRYGDPLAFTEATSRPFAKIFALLEKARSKISKSI